MKHFAILTTLVFAVVPGVSQGTVIDLDAENPAMFIAAPQGFVQASYLFGPVPPGEGTNGQGLTIHLNPGEALTLYAPPTATGTGLVHVQCSVRVNTPDVALAIAALNVTAGGAFADMDGSITTNQPANGEAFLNQWGKMETIIDPAGNGVVPVIQAVPKASTPVTVYFDEIVLTPLRDLSAEELATFLDVARAAGTAPTSGPTLMNLDAVPEGAVIAPPAGLELANYAFGPVPPADTDSPISTNGTGLSISLNKGQALTVFAPPVTTGPGLVHAQCFVRVDSPDVALAIATLNVQAGGTFTDMDGTITTSQPANGEAFLNHWGKLETVIDPAGDGVVPVIQAVAVGQNPVTVYFDEITITPMAALSPQEIYNLLQPRREPHPVAPTPTPIASPTPGPAGEIAIHPQDVKMLAGDSRAFTVSDAQRIGVNWIYKVNDTPGGNGDFGLIQAAPADPSLAVYTAPQTDTVLSVTISATDPDDSSISVSTTVTVYPLQGKLLIQPSSATLGLGGLVAFQAVFFVEEVGYLPFYNVYWKVNNQLRGNQEIGRISAFGLYRAPQVMPEPLPATISVGFSLSREQLPLQTAPVTLAQLAVSPGTFTSAQPGPVGQLSAVLKKSDNSVVPVPVADLTFISDVTPVATADNTGQVSIGPETGRAVITVRHKALGSADTAVVYSRSDVGLKANVVRLTQHDARIDRGEDGGVREIEYTSPGAKFYLVPEVTLLRGKQAGTELNALHSDAISFSGDGQSVLAYDERVDRVPHLVGIVALAERSAGVVRVGDTPGSGTITVTYDDGYVHHAVTLRITFSRLELAVTATGHISKSHDEAFITEYIDVEVALTNPNPQSDFIGRTPVAVTLTNPDTGGENEPFYAAYGLDVNTGAASIFGPYNRFNEVRRLLLPAQSTPDAIRFNWPPPGAFGLKISPKRVGKHRFRFTVENDPGIPPQDIQMIIKKPPLGLGDDLKLDSPFVVNSWVNVLHRREDLPYGVSVFDLASSHNVDVLNFARNDPPYWTVIRPSSTERIPVTDLSYTGGRFPAAPREPGDHVVRLGLTNRPEICSENLTFHVVSPESVGSVGKEPQANKEDAVIPATNQLGTFHILSPSKRTTWVKGVPIPITIQTYDSTGAPHAIGKTIITTRISTTPAYTDTTYSHTVMGIALETALNTPLYYTVEGALYPETSVGLIHFNLIPTSDAQGSVDPILKIVPRAYSPETFEGLPAEQWIYIDDEFTSREPVNGVAYGIAQFTKPKNNSYLTQYLFLSGQGVAVTPWEIPVASQRVRDYANRPDLTLDISPDVIFTALGTSGFSDSLATGLDVDKTDLGEGMHLIPERTKADPTKGKLLVTASTDPDTPLGDRMISLVCNDGQEWKGSIHLFKTEIKIPEDHADKNLPLNGNYHNAHPVGCQVFYVDTEDGTGAFRSTVPELDLELVPSIMPGDSYRGAVAENPLVGFKRSADPSTSATTVSNTTMELFQIHNNYFSVYGNINDRRSPDPEKGGLLGDPGHPDSLPDFVSRDVDAEQLITKLKGNVADILLFTAYNFVAKVDEDLRNPGLDFGEMIQSQPSIGEAYSRYSTVKPKKRLVSEVVGEIRQNSIAAYVDHEASGWDENADKDRLKNMATADFFAGILDQYYAWDGRTYPKVAQWFLARDGRVRPFNGDDRSGTVRVPTGAGRANFGIDLDGVLYDPMILGIDEDPNGPGLLSLPVVSNQNLWKDEEWGDGVPKISDTTHLLPRQGGTSGGYFDLAKEMAGNHFVVAKTPGQEFPGLHAGYLINGTPEGLKDPYTGAVEDDIRDVILRRNPPNGALVEEEVAFGIKQKRRVLAFARNEDHKEPIQTAAQTHLNYLITSDPEGIQAPVKAALVLREKPSDPVDSVALLVTTQSMGNEHTTKILLDNLIDLAVNVVATVTLTALTEGEYLAACGGKIAEDAGTALLNLGVGMMESEYVESYVQLGEGTQNAVQFANGVLNDGVEVAPGAGVQVTAGDLVKVDKLLTGKVKLDMEPGLPICALLQAPFEVLKGKLKSSFSAEDLGGNGSAEALGVRTLAICIPQSAWRGQGMFSAEFSTSRHVDILPKEPSMRELSQWDFFNWGGAELSDIDLIQRVIDYTEDSDHGAEARTLLKRMAIQSIHREPGEDHDNIYEDYKLRYSRLPSIEAVLIPGADLGNGLHMGDWEFKTGETKVPVAIGSMVSVSRSNENAGARAIIRSKGYEMILINATIPSPPTPGP